MLCSQVTLCRSDAALCCAVLVVANCDHAVAQVALRPGFFLHGSKSLLGLAFRFAKPALLLLLLSTITFTSEWRSDIPPNHHIPTSRRRTPLQIVEQSHLFLQPGSSVVSFATHFISLKSPHSTFVTFWPSSTAVTCCLCCVESALVHRTQRPVSNAIVSVAKELPCQYKTASWRQDSSMLSSVDRRGSFCWSSSFSSSLLSRRMSPSPQTAFRMFVIDGTRSPPSPTLGRHHRTRALPLSRHPAQ